jgi:hypothetical protein
MKKINIKIKLFNELKNNNKYIDVNHLQEEGITMTANSLNCRDQNINQLF